MMVVMIPAKPALACSCAPVSVEEAWQQSEIVFAGTLSRLQGTGKNSFNEQRVKATFTAERFWKGEPTMTVTLQTVLNQSSCEGYFFEADASFLVYATRNEKRELTTGLCTRTTSDVAREAGALNGLATLAGFEIKTPPESSTPNASTMSDGSELLILIPLIVAGLIIVISLYRVRGQFHRQGHRDRQ